MISDRHDKTPVPLMCGGPSPTLMFCGFSHPRLLRAGALGLELQLVYSPSLQSRNSGIGHLSPPAVSLSGLVATAGPCDSCPLPTFTKTWGAESTRQPLDLGEAPGSPKLQPRCSSSVLLHAPNPLSLARAGSGYWKVVGQPGAREATASGQSGYG